MYLTNADVASFLGSTLTPSQQTLVDSIIAAVEAYADSYCNRTFVVSGNQTETFDGGVDRFFIKFPPIASIVSVTINGNSYDISDVFNYKHYVLLEVKAEFGNQNVAIVYISGITVPSDLKSALVRWVSQIFQESGAATAANRLVDRVTVGTVTIEYSQSGASKVTVQGVPDFALAVLNRYRLETI